MISRNLVALALVAVCSSPASSQLTTRSWRDQCTSGALQACTSVSIALIQGPLPAWGPGIHTTVLLMIQNLQGSANYLPNPGPTALKWFRFSNVQAELPEWGSPAWYLAGSGSLGLLGNAVGNGSPFGGGVVDPRSESMVVEGVHHLSGTRTYGCDGPPDEVIGFRQGGQWTSGPYGVSTCGGWTVVMFSLPSRWSLTDKTEMTFWGEADGVQVTCTTKSSCTTFTP